MPPETLGKVPVYGNASLIQFNGVASLPKLGFETERLILGIDTERNFTMALADGQPSVAWHPDGRGARRSR
jgi:hypothetical protein